MNNTVSIIVPVYNASDVIADTITSVNEQTYKDFELILVDDGSTDDSRSIITGLISDRIKLIANSEKKGAAGARNTGIKAAEGRYIAFLDADDLWDEKKLEKQIGFMNEKGAAFSFTGYEFGDCEGRGLGKKVRVPDVLSYKQALRNTTIFTSTVMFDMSMLKKEDITMPYVPSEDTATWWKVLKSGNLAYGLDESLTVYRRSKKTLSSNKLEAVARIWNLYRKVEHLGIAESIFCFCFWAVRAVYRRV